MSIDCENVKYNAKNSETAISGEFAHFIPNSSACEHLLSICPQWLIEPCFLPKRYESIFQEIYNFEVRADDLWVVSCPKSGTTWAQEMVWMLSTNQIPNKSLIERYHFLESEILSERVVDTFTASVLKASQMQSPRFIKTHLPIGLLPQQLWTVKPKIIYICRNAKDAAVSYYHHMVNLQGYKGTLNEFLNGFLNDQQLFLPFHSHVMNFWNIRNMDNICFIYFEQMKFDLYSIVQCVAHHLNKSYTQQRLKDFVENLSFEKMRSNVFTSNETYVKNAKLRVGDKFNVGEHFKYECLILFILYLL